MKAKLTHEIHVSSDDIFKIVKAQSFAKFSGDNEKMHEYTMTADHRKWFDNYFANCIGDLQTLCRSLRHKCQISLPELDPNGLKVFLTMNVDYPLKDESIDAIEYLLNEIISIKILMAWFETKALPDVVQQCAGTFLRSCNQFEQLCLSLWYQNHSSQFYDTDTI